MYVHAMPPPRYGNDIAGVLPRSWMKQQWSMNKQIIERYRSLGMSAQLPAFQVANIDAKE